MFQLIMPYYKLDEMPLHHFEQSDRQPLWLTLASELL